MCRVAFESNVKRIKRSEIVHLYNNLIYQQTKLLQNADTKA